MVAHTNHVSFRQPASDSLNIWRYVELAKYLDLITSKTLFLARSDILSDKFEGSTTHINTQATREIFEAQAHMPEMQISQVLANLGKVRTDMKQQVYVNCWHMSEFESEAMWTLYGRFGDAIAIRTQYSSVVRSLPESFYVGAVSYIDYKRQFIPDGNMLTPFMHKRLSFEHEKEVRILTWLPPSLEVPNYVNVEEFGLRILVDLPKMIDEVYVAPDCPDWQYRLVAKISSEFLPGIPVKRSSLEDPAIF